MAESFFDLSARENKKKSAPLAERVRPVCLDDFYGQEHITGKGKLLRRMIEADRITSMVFYGGPGVGKTTLARIIANTTNSEFVTINAVTSGVKDIKDVIDGAKKNLSMYNKKTILFIDEIHRFNKAQQDALLPAVEDATVILIGATTENPYFEINPALISRTTVFGLKNLTEEDITKVIVGAISNSERGLGIYPIDITDEALAHLANISNGDARTALNALELAFLTTPKNDEGRIVIDLSTAEECAQKRAVNYDKTGENHYDTISAFIKSMRGSDPDAAVYWLAKMLYAGEDPKFVARRMVVFASEDVGLANSRALEVSINAFRAVELIGMPECKINLAHAAVYLALCPKSNASYAAFLRAYDTIENKPTAAVPYHLRNKLNKDIKQTEKTKPYRYPHDYNMHYVKQSYLPEDMADVKFYYPGALGEEKSLNELMDRIKEQGGETGK